MQPRHNLYQQVVKDIRHDASNVMRELKDASTDTHDALWFARSLQGHVTRLVAALENEPENLPR